MMILVSIVPIIVIIILLAGVAKSTTRWRMWNGKGAGWLIKIYAAILFISVCIFYFLPIEDGPLLTKRELDERKLNTINFYDAATNGTIHETKGVYRNGEWEFDFTGEKLDLVMGDELGILVVVEKKETNDQKIEVISYATELMIDDNLLKERLNPPRLELTGQSLRIIQPIIKELDYKMFDKEFTITQFKEGRSKGESIEGNVFMGGEILYLRVPKDVSVHGARFELVEK